MTLMLKTTKARNPRYLVTSKLLKLPPMQSKQTSFYFSSQHLQSTTITPKQRKKNQSLSCVCARERERERERETFISKGY